MLSFRPEGSVLLASDNGGPEITVTQASADWYCSHFLEQGLREQFNDLWKAMDRAGFVPWCDRRAA